jgi:AraC family transcriptional regulator of adaptative response / DNA-3-methyladenine glycosylase II
VVRRALRLINDGCLDGASVDTLAATVGVGPRHLHRLFLQHVGASPVVVAQTRRVQFAKRLIDETNLPITEVALAAGFGSLRRFNGAFQATYGRAPRDLRRLQRFGLTAEAGEVVLRLAFRPPYDWPQVLDHLAARAVPGVERVDARGYARTVRAGDSHAFIWVRPKGREHALEFRVRGAAPSALFHISSAARRMFDLAADPGRIVFAFRADPLLAPIVKDRPGLRIPGVWDPFECAVRVLLGQPGSAEGAGRLTARLVARVGQPIARVGLPIAGGTDGLTHLFPSAAALAASDLEGLGLTATMVAALRGLARLVSEDGLDFSEPAEEVAAALEAATGCSPWLAQYVALHALGDPDAFPGSDLVLRRMAGAAGRTLSASALEARAEAWRPWRAYAAMHLWQAAGRDRVALSRRG